MIILLDVLQIISRRIRLPNSPRREIHNIVSIPRNIRVQLRDADMGPVATDHREHMAERVGFRDCAVNIGDDDEVRAVPEEDTCRACDDT